jgi:hypothetical protein
VKTLPTWQTGVVKQEMLCENGFKCLQDKGEWPDNLVTQSSPASEAKATKEILGRC